MEHFLYFTPFSMMQQLGEMEKLCWIPMPNFQNKKKMNSLSRFISLRTFFCIYHFLYNELFWKNSRKADRH